MLHTDRIGKYSIYKCGLLCVLYIVLSVLLLIPMFRIYNKLPSIPVPQNCDPIIECELPHVLVFPYPTCYTWVNDYLTVECTNGITSIITSASNCMAQPNSTINNFNWYISKRAYNCTC